MIDIPLTLTIAGSDSSGGAGMQADLKTFAEYGTYGLVALTAIVTMDPDNNWAHGVTPIDNELIREQLKTILAGKRIKAMKTGMLASSETIALVKEYIEKYNFENVVIDPVMVCKGENTVLNPDNANALRDLLLPLATVITPNLFEAGVLSGMGQLKTKNDMEVAAKKIIELGAKNVVIKGGKSFSDTEAIDLFYDGTNFNWMTIPKVNHSYNHGAGCTFAAAITAGLANNLSVSEAVVSAKEFVTSAITHGFAFNEFIGPVFHSAKRICSK